jgi:hypothetical protein
VRTVGHMKMNRKKITIVALIILVSVNVVQLGIQMAYSQDEPLLPHVIQMSMLLKRDPEIESTYNVIQYDIDIPGAKLVTSQGDNKSVFLDRTRFNSLDLGNLELRNGTTIDTGRLSAFYNVNKIIEYPDKMRYFFGEKQDFLLMGSDTIGRDCGGVADVYNSPDFTQHSEGPDVGMVLICYDEGEKKLPN